MEELVAVGRGAVAGTACYPTRREFTAAGLDGVYQAISRTRADHARWAERYGSSDSRHAGQPQGALSKPWIRGRRSDLPLDTRCGKSA